MRQLNQHIKEIMGIKPKEKTDYTKSILWIGLVVFTIVLWITIYNLIF